MISVEEARKILLEHTPKYNEHWIPVTEALGKLTLKDIVSTVNVPLHHVSTRDGYLWKTKWGPGSKPLKGSVFAGPQSGPETQTDPECTKYIATGGVVPDEYDTVVMQEHVIVTDGAVTVAEVPEAYKWIRKPGSDVTQNQLLVSAGSVITAYTMALLISCGVSEVYVSRESDIVVGVMSNGNELVEPGHPLCEGQIYDSNRHMLISKLREYPVDVLDMGIAGDTREAITTAIQSGVLSGCDIILTSGGTSVGQRDYLPEVIRELGGTLKITRINMMPGKPFLFSVLPCGTCIVGLAGNPVSSMVGWELLVKPWINHVYGLPSEPSVVSAVLMQTVTNKDTQRPHYIRAKLTRTTDSTSGSVLECTPTEHQVSSNISGISQAHGLLRVEPGATIESNTEVSVVCMEEDDRMWLGPEPARRNAKFGVIVASDRASAGVYTDKSGPAIVEWIQKNFINKHEIVKLVVPDNSQAIEAALMYLVRIGCSIVFTTGGTGPTLRDVTAQVTERFVHKVLPGFGELLRHKSLKYTPTAILSGQLCGVVYTPQGHGALVLNLPGAPNSIAECLDEVKAVLPKSAEFASGDWLETDPPAFRGRSSKFFTN